MAIFKKDRTAVLSVISLMVTAMVLSSCQAADCHRRGFQVGVGLVHCMDGRPDQCCCVHGGLLHPDDKLTTN
uniref:Hydrophobic seed protein domain-containing protein n=1 Tax=Oryza meridionalis TaxID=40149 RepID=A0A0E0CKC1_9ORYZ